MFKYIIAALALACVGLGVTVGVQEARISSLKTQLHIAVLERDSFLALSERQSENLVSLKSLLAEAENACLTRIEVRKMVDLIFKPSPIKHVPAHDAIVAAVTPLLPDSSTGEAATATHRVDWVIDKEINSRVINDNQSLNSLRLINDVFGVFRPEGGL